MPNDITSKMGFVPFAQDQQFLSWTQFKQANQKLPNCTQAYKLLGSQKKDNIALLCHCIKTSSKKFCSETA